jgi:pimeloyl-ACP methyl ester carboxylesterase
VGKNTKQNIVFLPGLLCDKNLFDFQIRLFEKKFNCFVPEYPNSAKLNSIVDSVIDDIPFKEYHLICLSMGGYIAFEIMKTQLKKIKNIALLNTKIREDTYKEKQKRIKFIDASLSNNLFNPISKVILSSLIGRSNQNNIRLIKQIREMAARVGKDKYISHQRAIIDRKLDINYFTTIKKKFLIIVGDEDMITPKDDALFLSKIFKNSKLIIIKKCGHLSSMEKPLLTYKYLKGFLNLMR